MLKTIYVYEAEETKNYNHRTIIYTLLIHLNDQSSIFFHMTFNLIVSS